MTITDQVKILDRKVLQNEAQHDLDKKTAIISAQSSKNHQKVEYLTGEDLSLRPNTIEQVNLNILHLVKFLIKVWIKMIKKKVFLKG